MILPIRIASACLLVFALVLSLEGAVGKSSDILRWPEPTRDNRPWTRWWWLGSAVDKPNLTSLLRQYREAGFGGVEICPIYGAKGAEERYIDFLSPRWMEALAHTTSEGKRLGLGVDLTDGSGWPFGGPHVTAEDASSRIAMKRYEVMGGRSVREPLPQGRIQCVLAVSQMGERVDLMDRNRGGMLEWTAPAGNWRIYALVQQGPIQKVKRAAPGGVGDVLDPYSPSALDGYLSRFDQAFQGFKAPRPRAHFHDSFEYYGSSWTPHFLAEFRRLRGYDLQDYLPALFGDAPDETAARVKHDYRETLADLHLAFIRHWTLWTRSHGGISRNQSHGAPANLIDLYAAVDIPETEIFGALDYSHLPIQKLASSAAHLSGKPLASAEAFTWLGEHFQTSLADLKPAADYLFLAGINHLIYHGVPYSPSDAAWPGWLFYAAVHFGPNGGLWHHLPAFNAYVTRCQSILQAGKPDNDVLLYFPIHDLWQAADGLVQQLPIEGKWLWPTPFADAARILFERGYSFDQVSDSLLESARVTEGRIQIGDGRYHAIVIPRARVMPPSTLRKLVDLAESGGRLVFWGGLPHDVPGLASRASRLKQLSDLRGRIVGRDLPDQRDTILAGEELAGMLDRIKTPREEMTASGLHYIRRARPAGRDYFIVNRAVRRYEGWTALGTACASAALLDPRFQDRIGLAATRRAASGAAEVYLQLDPGESVILRTVESGRLRGKQWTYTKPVSSGIPIKGTWKVIFTEGGPVMPAPYAAETLASWTASPDPEAKRFAGSAQYTVPFMRPAAHGADDWLLDLGTVRESARVRMNGRSVGTLWSAPFRIPVGRYLAAGRNTLEVEVTNLAANRIADMDRRSVPWKIFHEINFVGRNYRPFDASTWPLRDSGLLGPVHLIPFRSSPRPPK